MTINISDTLLSRLSEFLAARMGLHFPEKRRRDLERGISAAARDFCFENAEACIRWLMTSPLTKERIEILARHLTIGETYFFREKRGFEILEEHILREIIRSRRGIEQYLRIWSAGCSTGEEPYSVAILLSKMIPDLKNWNVTILATDINPHFLQKAFEGVYGEWSFRDTSPWIKERYFKRTKEGRLEILPHIKKMVTFSYLNLAEEVYPSFLNNTDGMDVIFCRNVLMYFAPEQRERVVQNLYRSLVNGGWLMVSPGETLRVLSSQFVTVNFTGATLYKKEQQKIHPAQEFEAADPFFVPQTPVNPGLEIQSEVFFINQSDSLEETIAQPLVAGPEQQRIREHPGTLYEEALALYGRGRYAEAAAKLAGLFSDGVPGPNELNPGGKAMALLARACANQGKLAEALEWCEKAVAADKLNAGFHYLLATILLEQGQVEVAKTSLKRALYLDQDFVIAYFALGNLTRQQGKFKESVKHFENALLLLRGYGREDTLPESDGITAGRLREIITSMTERETLT